MLFAGISEHDDSHASVDDKCFVGDVAVGALSSGCGGDDRGDDEGFVVVVATGGSVTGSKLRSEVDDANNEKDKAKEKESFDEKRKH